MTELGPPRARRVAVAADERLIGSEPYDYADAFEIEVVEQESRSAEQLARFALEEASPSVRRTIQIAHRTLLRFQVGPASSRDHILGLTIVTSRPDVVVLEGVSHILRAVIVVKKTEPRRLLISTYVFYLRPAVAGLLLKIVGPVHRRIAPYLLERTAFTKQREGRAIAPPHRSA